ncbi:MAG: M48 family metalloprotease [Magnetococcus sp. DMHC-6]
MPSIKHLMPNRKNTTILWRLPTLIWLGIALFVPFLAAEEKDNHIRLVVDPEIIDLLDTLGKPLTQAAHLPDERVLFHVLLDPTLNAMALPNQHILINSGLILASADEDELASVLAHEIGHLTAGHHIQLQSEARNVAIQTLVLSAIGLGAGLATGSDALTQGSIVGSTAAAQAAMLDSSRQKERQADQLGVEYLLQAGYDPIGSIHFLQRIERQQRLSNIPPPYLLTHPLSSQRLIAIQTLIDQTKPTPHKNRLPKGQFQRVRAKLEAGTSDNPTQTAELFKNQIKTISADKNAPLDDTANRLFAARYGLTLSIYYAGRLPEALDGINQLQDSDKIDPYLLRERGLIHLELGQFKHALNDFNTALQQKPNEKDIKYRLALTYKELGNYEQSSQILRQLTAEHATMTNAFYLLGQVEFLRHNQGSSHLALARYHRLLLENDNAIWHYREAIRLFPKNSPEKGLGGGSPPPKVLIFIFPIHAHDVLRTENFKT